MLSRCYVTSQKIIQKNLSSVSLVYNAYGDPVKVVKKVEDTLKSPLEPNEVLVNMMASPVNPADINMIQGTYALKPSFPAVGGNEGVGQIAEVGSNVRKFKVGSWVLPSAAGWGTWRTSAICPESDLIEIPNDIPLLAAATLAVNPCTAYRMLKDFQELKKGDSVIQNGANSAVGLSVIQLCKLSGINTINVVRNRPDIEDLKAYLKTLGADYVVTEDIVSTRMEEIFKNIPKPKLALNCVGGKIALDMLRHLGHDGTMVTYGGMSKQPVTVPTSALIFKNLSIEGYWMTRWSNDNSESPERKNMLDYLSELFKKEQLKIPKCKMVPFDNFEEALNNAMKPFTSEKQVLVMDNAP